MVKARWLSVGKLLVKLGYVKGGKFLFLNKQTCGVWLIWVSMVVLLSAMFGGDQKINQSIFYIGYFAGLFLTVGNKALIQKLSYYNFTKLLSDADNIADNLRDYINGFSKTARYYGSL